MMPIISSDMAQDNLSVLIEQVAQSHEPIQIVSGVRSAWLVAEEDWQSIQETLYLVSIPAMRESILEGMRTPVEACSEEPGWRLGESFLPSKPGKTLKSWLPPICVRTRRHFDIHYLAKVSRAGCFSKESVLR